MFTRKSRWGSRGRTLGGRGAHRVIAAGRLSVAATGRRAKANPGRAEERARARKVASSYMIGPLTVDRFAGGGTTLGSAAGSIVDDYMYVKHALAHILFMHAMAVGSPIARTRPGAPRRGASQPDKAQRWAMPRAHRSHKAQRGAHVADPSYRHYICSVEHNESHRSPPFCKTCARSRA